MKLDNIQSIDVFDPSNRPLRNKEGLKGKWKRDNRRFIKLVGTSYTGKNKELAIFLNNDMVSICHVLHLFISPKLSSGWGMGE